MIADFKLKNQADNFRQDYGLGHKDPINIKSLLLKLKTLTVFKPLNSEHLSGIAIKANNLSFALINTAKSLGHQNFTILHELYHLYIQDDFHYMICNPKYSHEKGIERLANSFAAHVLLPEEGILDLLPNKEKDKNKISLGSLYEIEQYFLCSRTALLLRLHDLKLIDRNYVDKFSDNIIRDARLLGYDTDLYRADNKRYVIGDYGKLAKALFDREIISESHYASLMHDIGIDIDTELLNNGN